MVRVVHFTYFYFEFSEYEGTAADGGALPSGKKVKLFKTNVFFSCIGAIRGKSLNPQLKTRFLLAIPSVKYSKVFV